MDLDNFDLYQTLNGISKHSPSGRWIHTSSDEDSAPSWLPWNEDNFGAGIKLKNREEDGWLRALLLGNYHNSIDKESVYAAAELGKRLLGNDTINLNGSVLAGLVSGYNDSVIPLLTPRLTLGLGPLDLNLGYIPELKGITPEVFTLNADFRLPKNLLK